MTPTILSRSRYLTLSGLKRKPATGEAKGERLATHSLPVKGLGRRAAPQLHVGREQQVDDSRALVRQQVVPVGLAGESILRVLCARPVLRRCGPGDDPLVQSRNLPVQSLFGARRGGLLRVHRVLGGNESQRVKRGL